MKRERLLEMITAYVLGALDTDDVRAIEELLAYDDEAQRLRDEYQAVADAIALTAPAAQPPDDLETRLLQRARGKRRGRPRWYWLGAAAAALVVVLAATLLLTLTSSRPDVRQEYERIAGDPGAERIALVPVMNADIEGQMVYCQDEAEAVIRVSNLPPLEPYKAFQLWLVDEDGSASGGVYRLTDETNYIRVPLTKPVSDYVRFGVSLEPASGSPLGNKPSGPQVFGIPVDSS